MSSWAFRGPAQRSRLLALDEGSRYPKTYELLDPLPKAGLTAKKQIKYISGKLDLIKEVIPQIEAIHELGAEEAEECLLGLSVKMPLLPPTFRSIIKDTVQRAQAGEDFPDMGFPDMSNGYALYCGITVVIVTARVLRLR